LATPGIAVGSPRRVPPALFTCAVAASALLTEIT
jgi:hypothetical protein